MQQNKRKILCKQILSENNCTKMCICIHPKPIGNCLDNLVLAKQVPQFMKTSSKGNSEKRVTFLTKQAKKAILYFTVNLTN